MPHLQIKELRVTIIKQFLQPSGCLFSNESHRFPWLESTMMFAQLKHQKSFTSSPGWVLVRAMHQGDIHSVPQLWQESLPARMQTASPSSVFTPAKRQRMKEESHRPPFVCSVHSGSPCTNHIYLKIKNKKRMSQNTPWGQSCECQNNYLRQWTVKSNLCIKRRLVLSAL